MGPAHLQSLLTGCPNRILIPRCTYHTLYLHQSPTGFQCKCVSHSTRCGAQMHLRSSIAPLDVRATPGVLMTRSPSSRHCSRACATAETALPQTFCRRSELATTCSRLDTGHARLPPFLIVVSGFHGQVIVGDISLTDRLPEITAVTCPSGQYHNQTN
jgi:hypothetical protein